LSFAFGQSFAFYTELFTVQIVSKQLYSDNWKIMQLV